jgi:hypothetical protein
MPVARGSAYRSGPCLGSSARDAQSLSTRFPGADTALRASVSSNLYEVHEAVAVRPLVVSPLGRAHSSGS